MRQDLSLQLWEKKSHRAIWLHGLWRYKKDLFKDETIARIANRFQAILESIVINPGQSVEELIVEIKGEFVKRLQKQK
jgi:hypothetical protein